MTKTSSCYRSCQLGAAPPNPASWAASRPKPLCRFAAQVPGGINGRYAFFDHTIAAATAHQNPCHTCWAKVGPYGYKLRCYQAAIQIYTSFCYSRDVSSTFSLSLSLHSLQLATFRCKQRCYLNEALFRCFEHVRTVPEGT